MAKNTLDNLIDQALAQAEANGRDLDERVEVHITRRRNQVATWLEPAPKGSLVLNTHHDANPGDIVTMPARAAVRLTFLGMVDGGPTLAELEAKIAAGTFGAGLIDDDDDEPLGADLSDEERADLAAYTQEPASTGQEAPTAPGAGPIDLSALGQDGPPKPATVGAGVVSELTDDELTAKDAPELVGHLTAFAGDAERIRVLELARPKPRITVLRATGLTDEAIATLEAAAPPAV